MYIAHVMIRKKSSVTRSELLSFLPTVDTVIDRVVTFAGGCCSTSLFGAFINPFLYLASVCEKFELSLNKTRERDHGIF